MMKTWQHRQVTNEQPGHKNAASERVHQGKHRLTGTCKCNTAVGVPVPGGQANQTTRSLNHATCKNHSVAALQMTLIRETMSQAAMQHIRQRDSTSTDTLIGVTCK